MRTHAAYHFTLACKGLLTGVTCALQLWLIRKRGVRDDIKYT